MTPRYREIDMREVEKAQHDALSVIEGTRPRPVAKRAQLLAIPDGPDRETRVLALFERAVASVNAAEGIIVKAQIARDALAFRSVVSAYKLSIEVEMRAAEATVLCMRSLGLALLDEYPNMNAKTRGAKTGLGTYPCVHAVAVAEPSESTLDETFRWLKARGTLPSIGKVIRALKRREQYGSLDRAEELRPISPRNQYALAVIYPTDAASCERAIERLETVVEIAADEDGEHKMGIAESRPFRADERHFFDTLLRYLKAHAEFVRRTNG